MFCNHCGTAVEDGALLCPNCGQKPFLEAPAQPVPEQPVCQQLPVQQKPLQNTTPILTLGIVALAVASLGIPGIVVGAIGRSKYMTYLREGGTAAGKAKVGGILSKAGLITGIAMTAFWIIYVIFYIVLIALIIKGGIHHYYC